jgi:hypothetical protein
MPSDGEMYRSAAVSQTSRSNVRIQMLRLAEDGTAALPALTTRTQKPDFEHEAAMY